MFFKSFVATIVAVVGTCILVEPAKADEVWGAIAAYVEDIGSDCKVGSGSAWNYSTHWEAGNAAMSHCTSQSSRCQDAVFFQGSGMCGAVAIAAWNDYNGAARCAFGSGKGGSNSSASNAAMSSCQSTGAEGCYVSAVHCND